MHTNRRIVGIVMLGALVLVGCSTSGTPQSGNTAQSQAPADSAEPSALAALDPCSLITDSEASRVHLKKSGPEKPPQGRGCGWDYVSGDVGDANGFSLGATIYDHLGVKDFNKSGMQVQQISVNNRSATQTYNGDVCSVDIPITDSSAVTVNVEADAEQRACQFANQFAELIEPRLPKV